MAWNLTVVRTNTGERIKSECFSSRVEVDLRRAELQGLLASAHCTSRLVVIVTLEGNEASEGSLSIIGSGPEGTER